VKKYVCVGLLLCSLLAVRAHAGDTITVDVQPAWGKAEHVVAVEQLYLASQPDYQGYAAAAQSGVTAVINVRAADELDWDAAAAVEQAGMQYFNEPLIMSEHSLDAASLQRISKLVKRLQAEGETVMVHCSSGNRVAAWWAVDLAVSQKLDAPQAISVARKAGLTKPELIQLVEAQLTPAN
jgi:uncharacterized protein (TIGR01244 family)